MYTQLGSEAGSNKVFAFDRVADRYGVYSHSYPLAAEILLNRMNVLSVEEYK